MHRVAATSDACNPNPSIEIFGPRVMWLAQWVEMNGWDEIDDKQQLLTEDSAGMGNHVCRTAMLGISRDK